MRTRPACRHFIAQRGMRIERPDRRATRPGALASPRLARPQRGTLLASLAGMSIAASPADARAPRSHGASERSLERVASGSAAARELLDWLDLGLRGGRSGRLLAEYGPVLAEPGAAEHVVGRTGGARAAHVLWRVADAHAGDVVLPIGLIGLVYTDPRFRRAGHATRALEAALAAIADRGAVLALLWSDQPDFYARLGFAAVGTERRIALDAELCAAARNALGAAGAIEVGRCEHDEWLALERSYAGRRARLARPAGWLRRLASAPDCELRVARRDGRVVAYAACGRGDDLQGVIHEWAGEAAGVLACAESLLAGRARGTLLASTERELALRALALAGARETREPLALARILDASRIPGGAAGLTPTLAAPAWPLYLWGFDSI
jgi:GNAT superfamily N-acetyltransferase